MSQADKQAEALLQSALNVIETEADALNALKPRLDERFVAACQLLLAC